jgi:hypothetical protein
VFAAGEGLHVEATNDYYSATNAYVTVDDSSNPLLKVRAKSIRLLPGNKIEARNAVLYVGKVPVFYFPVYSRKLDEGKDHFNFVPGYRGAWDLFAEQLHVVPLRRTRYDFPRDYRVSAVRMGPDFKLQPGEMGAGSLKYYYLHDWDPHATASRRGYPRQSAAVWFSYLADPYTNLSVRSMVRYRDTNLVREFSRGSIVEIRSPAHLWRRTNIGRTSAGYVTVQPRVMITWRR